MFYVILALALILFHQSLFAFDSTYQTADSTPIIPIVRMDHRSAYNAPWSLCKLDGLDLNYCGKISLRFGGAPFKEAYYLEDYANQPASFFRNLTKAQAETLLANYYLPAFPNFFQKQWKFPTLGQLQYALNKNYVYTYSGNWYWFWNTKTNRLDRLMYNKSTGGNTEEGKAHLERVVTEDFPSACEQDECSKFYADRVRFRVEFKKYGSHNMKYKFCTTRYDGYQSCDDATAANTTYLPTKGYTTEIRIEYCANNTSGCYRSYTLDLSLVDWNLTNPTYCIAAAGNSQSTYITVSFQPNTTGSCTWKFFEEQGGNYSLFTWKNAATNIYWYVKYRDINRNYIESSTSVIFNGGTYTFPQGATEHGYKVCSASRCSKWGVPDFSSNYKGRCFSAHGSLLNPYSSKGKLANHRSEC